MRPDPLLPRAVFPRTQPGPRVEIPIPRPPVMARDLWNRLVVPAPPPRPPSRWRPCLTRRTGR